MRPLLHRAGRALGVAAAAAFVAHSGHALADDVAAWLQRAADAARQLNYVGTIVYQSGNRVEVSRLVHFSDGTEQLGKLVSLEGPAREVIRTNDQITCYLPDQKLIRIEPRTFRNVFPALSPAQLGTLSENYLFKRAEQVRIAGVETQAWVFEPRDGMRYGHKFWADVPTGLLIKARLLNERNETVEQFAFTDIQIGARVDRDMVKPSYSARASDWQVYSAPAEALAQDTGWTVRQLPPGFRKVIEAYRTLRGKPDQVAHLVYSDGLVAVSVFIEPTNNAPRALGAAHQGATNVYSRELDGDHVVTVVGEAPVATIRLFAR
jgi:sigma-E factor negative regulatory protein RseB